MKRMPPTPSLATCMAGDLRHRAIRGFTLIELLIAIVVIGLLTAVALPSFMDSIRKSRRSEAIAALSILQQAQERWRSDHANYTTDLGASTGLNVLSPTASGYYTIAVASADATGYVATATPVAGTLQAGDAQCTLFAVSMQDGRFSQGSNSSTLPLSDNNKCWAR